MRRFYERSEPPFAQLVKVVARQTAFAFISETFSWRSGHKFPKRASLNCRNRFGKHKHAK
jgi:hypothetical protein